MKSPLGHRTLSAAIVEEVRRDILNGTYPAGEQLRQDVLAATFQVSRIPVREALIQLESEGLVVIEPHKGAIVSSFSLEEIDDVFDLRVMLEPRLLVKSIARFKASDFAEVYALETEFKKAIETHDVARWGLLNAKFHLALYKQAGLPRTHAIVTGLLQTSDRFTRIQMRTGRALDRAQKEHQQLLKLCQLGNAKLATEHLIEHIEKVRKDLYALFKKRAVSLPAEGK